MDNSCDSSCTIFFRCRLSGVQQRGIFSENTMLVIIQTFIVPKYISATSCSSYSLRDENSGFFTICKAHFETGVIRLRSEIREHFNTPRKSYCITTNSFQKEPLKSTITTFALLTPPFLRVAISLIFTQASWSPQQTHYLLKEGITAAAQVKTRYEHLLSIELNWWTNKDQSMNNMIESDRKIIKWMTDRCYQTEQLE